MLFLGDSLDWADEVNKGGNWQWDKIWTSGLFKVIEDAHETASHVSACFRQSIEGRSHSCTIPGKMGISSLPGYHGAGMGTISSDQGRNSLTIGHNGYHSICRREVNTHGFKPCFCKAGTGNVGDKLAWSSTRFAMILQRETRPSPMSHGGKLFSVPQCKNPF